MFEKLQQFGGKAAFITERDGVVSYAEFINLADRIGINVDARTLVFCLCSNELEAVAGYVGFLRNKVVSLMLPTSINLNSLNLLEARYMPTFIWAPLLDQDRLGKREIVFQEGGYALFSAGLNRAPSLHPDLALLMSTSGSTGSPQMVRLSFSNLVSNADSIIEGLGLTAQDIPITTLPMNYVYGLSIINSHLRIGGTIILNSRSLMDRGFWDLLKSKKATTFGGVPYTYEMIKRLGFDFLRSSSIEQLTQAGGRLEPSLVRDLGLLCKEVNKRFTVMYGQTEATSRMSILPSQFAHIKSESIGRAIPGGRLAIDYGDLGYEVAPGKIGELVYFGANVSLGYATSMQDLSRGDENQGILRTGDLAWIDHEGFYYIAGRKKRFLKIFGNRISLDDVEAFVSSEGWECACIGRDNDLQVYVTSPDNHKQLRLKVATFLGINHLAISISFVKKIPRAENGKVSYFELDEGN